MKKELNWGILSKYRNIIYGLACISIILFHYTVKVPYENSFKGMWTFVYRGVIGSIGVEIFILMSGICMYFSFYKKQDIKEFYIKRFRRLIIPFCLIVIPFYTYKDIYMNGLDFKRVLYDVSYVSFFTEGVISVWYILCIAIMYLLYPFFFKIFQKYDRYKHAMLAILLGQAIGINLILNICTPELYKKIEIMTMRFPIYVLGIYLGKKVYEKAKFNKVEGMLFIIGIIIKLTLDFLKYFELIIIPPFLSRYIHLNSSLVILGLTILLLYVLNIDSKNKCLTKCGLLSLELYLVHVTFMNILSSYKVPIYKYSYFAYYLIATILLSILVNNITNLLEVIIDKIISSIRIYNTCEWKLKKIYKKHTGRKFKGVIKLEKYNNKLYVSALEEIYNKLVYDLTKNETTLIDYANDIKYIKEIVKGYTELSNDVDDVVAIYLANMTDDYFIELYRKYFSRVSV